MGHGISSSTNTDAMLVPWLDQRTTAIDPKRTGQRSRLLSWKNHKTSEMAEFPEASVNVARTGSQPSQSTRG